jgi:uncharacterized protein YkwD
MWSALRSSALCLLSSLMLLGGIAELAPTADAASAGLGTKRRLGPIKLQAREEALREAVNAQRRRSGLAPLLLDPTLQREARAHTADMIRFGYLGHRWHDGTPFRRWVARHTSCDAISEILAWRSPQQTPAGAVGQWLDSPPHRALLLANRWTGMGVELRQQYATVDFGQQC